MNRFDLLAERRIKHRHNAPLLVVIQIVHVVSTIVFKVACIKYKMSRPKVQREIHASFVYEASGGDPVGVNSVDVSDAGQHVG